MTYKKMATYIPQWILKRYSILWDRMKCREFYRDDLNAVFKRDKSIPVFLSDLRKAGWIEIRLDEKDARKTVYRLKHPSKVILEVMKSLSSNEKKIKNK